MYFYKLYSVLLFIITFKSYVNSYNTSSLVLLQIIHRHGDRTPIASYKNDPYRDLKNWVDGMGELTPRGKHRMYTFGQQLRQRYGQYLGDSPKNIYLRSSPSDRCLESASAIVAGMYPPKDRWIWSQNDNIAKGWQPIAIQTVLKSLDGMLVPNSYCPAADEAYQEIMQTKPVLDFMAEQKTFIEKVNEKTGENLTTLRQMDYLYDTISHELNFDEPKSVPEWITELGNDTLDRLKQFQLNAFKYDWSSKKVQRLRGGLMFKELVSNFQSLTNSSHSSDNNLKKVYSYSTHDTIIVTILQALGLYKGNPPTYGSALLFELHRINDQYLVKLFYANPPIETLTLDIQQLDIKGCHSNQTANECKLSAFIDSVNEFIPIDWQKECESHKNEPSYTSDHKPDLLVTFTLIASLLLRLY